MSRAQTEIRKELTLGLAVEEAAIEGLPLLWLICRFAPRLADVRKQS